jgi:hypothetical protein
VGRAGAGREPVEARLADPGEGELVGPRLPSNGHERGKHPLAPARFLLDAVVGFFRRWSLLFDLDAPAFEALKSLQKHVRSRDTEQDEAGRATWRTEESVAEKERFVRPGVSVRRASERVLRKRVEQLKILVVLRV